MKESSHKKYISLYLSGYKSFSTTERNAYIFYVTLLTKFNNNRINKATLNYISSLTGVNKNSINNYISILKGMGLVFYDKKDLILKKDIKTEKKEKLYRLHLYRSLNFKNTKLIIEAQIIKLNLNKQVFAINAKKTLSGESQTVIINGTKVDFKNKKDYKLKSAFVRKIQKYGFRGDLKDEVFVSTRSIAKMLNISQSKANNLIKELKKQGIVTYRKKYTTIEENVSYDKYMDILGANAYYNEGFNTPLFFKKKKLSTLSLDIQNNLINQGLQFKGIGDVYKSSGIEFKYFIDCLY